MNNMNRGATSSNILSNTTDRALQFAQLYDAHVDALYNYGSRLTTDSELLKSSIHDAFVHLYSNGQGFACEAKSRAILIVFLKNNLCLIADQAV